VRVAHSAAPQWVDTLRHPGSESGKCALEPHPDHSSIDWLATTDFRERRTTVQGRALMNFRVFLLMGATAVFGALCASDGRYQSEQIALARLERARKSQPVAVLTTNPTMKAAAAAGKAPLLRGEITRLVASVAKVFALPKTQLMRAKIEQPVAVSATPAARNALLGRLIAACVFRLDLGQGIELVGTRVNLARTAFEERYCLLRFRTREAAFFASRRASVFLRAQMVAWPQPSRVARIIIREISSEESQAPAAGQTR
jgi:hypothetical protein